MLEYNMAAMPMCTRDSSQYKLYYMLSDLGFTLFHPISGGGGDKKCLFYFSYNLCTKISSRLYMCVLN